MKKNTNLFKKLSNLKCFGHVGKKITLICTVYSTVCATLYFISIPNFFRLVFEIEPLNSITGCLKLISFVGIVLSILCIICDCSFGFRISSSIISILGHIAFLSGKDFAFTLIPFILITIAINLYIKDNNKKRMRIIK